VTRPPRTWVSRGTFCFHFASKEDILLAMTSGTAQATIGQIEAGSREGVPPIAGRAGDGVDGRACRARAQGAAVRAGSVGFRARAGAVMLTGSRRGTAFASLLRYGKERGEPGTQVDPEETAAMPASRPAGF
jgi:AcrR family transcriptional regulator